MEEEKEKKHHGKKKRYRGKKSDRPKDQQRPAEAEQGGQKRQKPDKSQRSDNHQKKSFEDKKRNVKNEASEEASEDKSPRSKREVEEPVFEFTWADAWGLYGTGYHVVIKDSQEKLYLSWSVDLSYGEMKLGDRLQEFLQDMKQCGIASWDGRRYTKPGIFDGDTWSVKANSLSLKMETSGTNEYPAEWKNFLKCLHDKWNIPLSKREQWE